MSATNVDAMLAEVSPDAPCGANLEYDPEFMELMREAQGVPERQIGEMIVPAEEPNWRDVRKRSVELFRRTKDLTVALRLCEAALALDGLAGLRDGLAVIHGMLDRYWVPVHPQLDPSDGNDPTVRLNILVGLTDPAQVLSKLRGVPLTASPVGRFTLRDIAWATGRTPPPEDVVPPKVDIIEAAFKATAPDELITLTRAAEASVEALNGIDAILTRHLGAGRWVDFDPLTKMLREILTELKRRLPAGAQVGGDAGSAAPGQGDTSGDGGASQIASPGPSGRGFAATDGIHDTAGVIAAIDQICDYYARVEPSSPVPLLLGRAKKLVGKRFLDIVRDLSPEVLQQIMALGGVTEESDESQSA